jgi:predicted phosphodiesterase
MKRERNKNITELKVQIVTEAMEAFPSLPSHTLAKLVYNKNKKLFSCAEAVRSMIRIRRHKNGHVKSKSKKFLYQNKLVKETLELPQGLKSGRKPFVIPKQVKELLVISDLHIPYHDEVALEAALMDGKKNKCGAILINGDCVDYFALSRFLTDPRQRDIVGEIETTKKVLKYIRKKFPKIPIYWKKGNHEDRFEHYMILKAPELLNLNFWKLEDLYGLDELNITVIPSLDYVMAGKLKIIHGHEVKQGFIAPVNPARGLFLRVKESCLQSHVHRTSSHSEKTIGGILIMTYSIGCLADLQPDYNPYNQYNHGFARVTIESDGSYIVHNKTIINGIVYNG